MTVLIEHPKHGRMHVYSQAELKRHLEMGWSVVEEKTTLHLPRKKNDRK